MFFQSYCATVPPEFVSIILCIVSEYVEIYSYQMLSLFSGIGYATQIVIAYAAVSYIVIQAWAFFYLFSSFSAEVPWASCKNTWNTGAWH